MIFTLVAAGYSSSMGTLRFFFGKKSRFSGFAQKVGVSDPLARYARVSPSRGGEYISRNARVNPLLVSVWLETRVRRVPGHG
jgi:hypothetical protein